MSAGDDETRLKSLMLRGLAGEAAAHSDLLRALARLLRAFFVARLRSDRPTAEDLVQDTLIAIHQRRASYDRAQPLLPWVFAIARYRLIDHIRYAKRRPSAPIEEAETVEAEAQGDPSAARDLDHVLASLPDVQRRLIMDTKVEGLSVAEAALRNGVSVAAVKTAVHRGMKRLQARFSGGSGDAH